MADPTTTSLFSARQPMFSVQGGSTASVTSASLFVGEAEGGLFAALPGRLDAPLQHGDSKAARLRDDIRSMEESVG